MALAEQPHERRRRIPPRVGGADVGGARRAGEPDAGLLTRVAALLSPTPAPWDEIARAAGAPGPLVYAALVELSLAGRCELLPGGLAVSG